jgi:ABC-type multidrug transport system permease subunit
MMRYLFVAAAKDVRRRLSDPAALAVWVGIPLLLGGLMNLVAGDDGAPPRARVLVADQDGTIVSTLLTTAIGRAEIIDLQPVGLDEGRRRIGDGDATALLIVPTGFQEAVFDRASSELVLVTNPAERILPGIVEEALEIVVEGVFYTQRLFGPTLNRIASGAPPGTPSDTDVAAISVEINQQIARLQNVVIPPAIRLKVVRDTPQAQPGPSLNFGQLFLPGMLFMSFLFIATGMSVDIWEEQRLGTLRRALTTPLSAVQLLGGKLLAGIVLMTVIAFVALAGAVALFGIAWTRVPAALAWCSFAGGSLIALMTLLQMLASSQRGADLLANTVVFPLMMIGGSFFPFESMPAWMAAVGRWTPNGLAVVQLKDLLYGDVARGPLLVAVVGIGVPAAAAFLLAGRRLRGKFATL